MLTVRMTALAAVLMFSAVAHAENSVCPSRIPTPEGHADWRVEYDGFVEEVLAIRRLSGPPYTLIRCVRSWGAMQIVFHKTCTVIPKGGSITVQKAVAEVTTCKLSGLLPGLPDDRETNDKQCTISCED
jgi:hypothetical protein